MGSGYSVARVNPTPKKKAAAKKAPAKKTAAKKSAAKKGSSAIKPGSYVADINGQIFKVTHLNDEGSRVAVVDFDGKAHAYDKGHVRKTAMPYLPGERILRNGENYTVISQEFVGIVNARNTGTGVRTQLGAKGGVRENPIRTLEGRVLTAPGTRKSARKLFQMRKNALAAGETPPARIKLSSGKWLTYQSAQWVFHFGRKGTSSGGKKTSPSKSTAKRAPRSSAPKQRASGKTREGDLLDFINS